MMLHPGRTGGVVLSHPVHQHAYETAVAAQKAGFLRYFVTGLYRTGRGLSSERLWGWLPRRLRSAVEQLVLRRSHADIDPDFVRTVPWSLLLAVVCQRFLHLRRWQLESWAHERFDVAVARRLRRESPPAMVHAFEGSALETFRVARQRGIVTVLDVPSAHERYATILREHDPTRISARRIREERELADFLFVPSPFVHRCLTEEGVPTAKMVRIPYGVDERRFVPCKGRRSDGKFWALFVGSIDHRKGVRYLLEAWRRLGLLDGELILVGDADERGRDMLREYAGCYRWMGQVARYDVHRWFQMCDVFVLPSLAEGSALVTYEAMACGVPVVVTPECGAVVRDGLDGFVVPARDIGALQEKIAFLHDQPETRRLMGGRGRARIEADFTWAHYRRRVVAAYRAILAGHPVQAAVDACGISPASGQESRMGWTDTVQAS